MDGIMMTNGIEITSKTSPELVATEYKKWESRIESQMQKNDYWKQFQDSYNNIKSLPLGINKLSRLQQLILLIFSLKRESDSSSYADMPTIIEMLEKKGLYVTKKEKERRYTCPSCGSPLELNDMDHSDLTDDWEQDICLECTFSIEWLEDNWIRNE